MLAEAGILDGRRVTTHWAFARDLQKRVPKLKVEEDRIFIVDGPVWTSAGMTAGADAARLSPRQFSRAFRAETGQSPAKAVETLRVETARMMMKQGRHPMDVIAAETGFADRERMRRAFLRAFGQPPQAIRRNARSEAA